MGLIDRTFSSDLLPEPVKNRRAIICAKAISLADFPDAERWIFNRIMDEDQHEGLRTAEFSRILRGWAEGLGGNEPAAIRLQVPLYAIVAKARQRNDSWFILASGELGIPEAVLREYAAHGDSLSLAILIHLIRQQFSHFREIYWPIVWVFSILLAASKFDVQDTLLELQCDFCALWNQIVHQVQIADDLQTAFNTLGPIRKIYIALHQGTDSAPTQFSASTGDWDNILYKPSSYPVCNIPGHHPDSTPPASYDHGLGVSPSPIDCTVVPDNAALTPAPLATTLDVTSLSVSDPLHVDEYLVDVPLLVENSSISASFHTTHQTAMENLRSSGSSPDLVVTGATRDIGISPPPRMMRLITPGPSGSTPLPTSPSQTSTSVPDAVTIEHTADDRTSSLEVPSSPSLTQILDNIHPIVSHSLVLAPGASGPARSWLSSTPDIGAAEREYSAKAASGKDMDALNPALGFGKTF